MRVPHFFKLLPLLLLGVLPDVNANAQQIDPQTLLQLIQTEQAPLILDVRSKQEYEQGHVQGAINIAYDQLQQRISLLNGKQHQPLIIYCRSGRRAQHAYQTLHNNGFSNLTYLKGHMNLWQQQHFPLVQTN